MLRALLSLSWATTVGGGPVVSIELLPDEVEDRPADGLLQKGRLPIQRARPSRRESARTCGMEAKCEAEETVFLDLQLCFNRSVELVAVEFRVEDAETLRAGRLNWRILHPIPSSSQSQMQWFRLGEAWPVAPEPESIRVPGTYRSQMRPGLKLTYADCLGWSLKGRADPLSFDESTAAQVAWTTSSEGLHDAVELLVKQEGFDPLTSSRRKDPSIDWTGLERRTYSVRLLYREVEAPAAASSPEANRPRAAVVEGGNPACWRSGFTFQRCCKEEAEGCWDSSFTFERCCSLTQKRVADLEFRPSTASHYDLTHLHRDNQPRLGPVQDDEALLLYGIVRTVRPRTIVEFGTSHGFSALNWLHAIADDPDARVYSYDILPYPAAQALEDSDPRFIFHGKSQADFEAADVENRLVELAFFDAGHLVEYSLRAFERLLPSLTMNAIIAVHDTGLHVLDHGSGAPSEEEGLPFTEASCQRASSVQQCLRFNGCEGMSDLQGFCLGRAHRPSERRFVAEVVRKWPEFRPLHFHSRRVFRHGLTLLQRGELLSPEQPQGAF